jgi:hypothetical protein
VRAPRLDHRQRHPTSPRSRSPGGPHQPTEQSVRDCSGPVRR